MKTELDDTFETVESSLIGGDTASFRPLVIDDDSDDADEDDDTSEGIFEPAES